MRIQLLPSSFDENGCASKHQHLACFVFDECVAVDAGSLAMAATDKQREKIRDIVLTHAHLDHIAGLPLFIDDLFTSLESPINIFATDEVIEIIHRNIFNWEIYPDFAELSNKHGKILNYNTFENGTVFTIKHLHFKSVKVNHKVPTVGFIISDDKTSIAFSSDTSEMEDFWTVVNAEKNLSALFIECAFPDELEDLAHSAHHLTPKLLHRQLNKFNCKDCPVYVINIKPMYFEQIVTQIEKLKISNLEIFNVGEIYHF